jgi:hypothetical protein
VIAGLVFVGMSGGKAKSGGPTAAICLRCRPTEE